MSRYLDFRLAGEPRRLLFGDDVHSVIEIAVTVARDMALHGYLAQSAEIIAPIWNFSVPGDRPFSHDFVRNTISTAGVEMLWKAAKFKPKGFDGWQSLLSELKYTDKQLEIEQRHYFCQNDPTVEVGPATNIPEWIVMQRNLSVRVDPQTGVAKLPTRGTENTCLWFLCYYIDDISPPSAPERVGSRPLALGLDLALKYDDHAHVRKIFERFGSRIANMVPDACRELALAPRTGRIVCKMTAIREATGLTVSRAQAIASELVDSLRIRLYSGEPRPHSDLSWRRLLAEIEKREIELQEEEHEAVLPFLRPPATREQIEQAETQLGISLPQDYKDFLAVSDGLGSHNLAQTTPLLSVDEIFWDVEHRNMRVEYRRFETPNEKAASLPCLDRVLQISEADEDAAASWWLIEPSLICSAKDHMGEAGTADWLGVNYAEWNPIFSNRGSFRYVACCHSYCADSRRSLMMERRLSLLMDLEGRLD
ncbi:hypothetical protein FRC10_007804 [Ceratobasidium sp. 414]|nr:hypothetical protein FRC10_007804 [Ceratobasidium sp. 414]